jgi:hypothetical protein
MNSTTESASENVERLSWSEICKRFPRRVGRPRRDGLVNDTDFAFGTAVVVAHHPHRKTVSPAVKAAFERYHEVGCFWTGEIGSRVSRFTPRA